MSKYIPQILFLTKFLHQGFETLMKNKIPFRVFFILSAYSDNMWKVFQAYMENTPNLGLFEVLVHKVVSEYTERIFAHMESTPRDTKLGIF
jgi:hypothetical protein